MPDLPDECVLYFALLAFVHGLRPKSLKISAQHDNECCVSGDFQYIAAGLATKLGFFR